MKWIAKYHPELKSYTVDEEESGEMICTIDVEGKNKEEAESITRLIASAPELLTLLRQISNLDLEDQIAGAEYATLSHKVKELIKKITGYLNLNHS